MPKRYVCSLCLGKGKNTVLVFDPGVSSDDHNRAEPDYSFKEESCSLCIGMGAPSFIDVNAPWDNALIDVEHNTTKDEVAPPVQNTEQKEDNHEMPSTK